MSARRVANDATGSDPPKISEAWSMQEASEKWRMGADTALRHFSESAFHGEHLGHVEVKKTATENLQVVEFDPGIAGATVPGVVHLMNQPNTAHSPQNSPQKASTLLVKPLPQTTLAYTPTGQAATNQRSRPTTATSQRSVLTAQHPQSAATNQAQRPHSAATNQAQRPHSAANLSGIAEIVDNTNPAEDDGDPFEQLVQQIVEEHKRQINFLNAQLEDRNEKLNIVLSSTWGFSEEGWHANPKGACGGALDLVVAGRHAEAESKVWTVSEDEHAHLKRVNRSGFKSRPVWKSYDWMANSSDIADLALLGKRESATHFNEDVQYGHGGTCCGPKCARLIAHPASPQRLVWDCAAMALLLWDVVMIPMSAYTPLRSTFFRIMDWVTLLFWTSDMVASFLTGFMHQGKTIMDPLMIAKQYMSVWFWIDICIVGPDWIFTIVELALEANEDTASSAGNASSLIRIVRAVRVLRLLRMAKMKRYVAKVKDMITSERVFLMGSILQFIIILFFGNHFIGAGWYLVGDIGRESNAKNWIDERDIKDEDLLFRYLHSLHWSLSQFAPGWFHSAPNNSIESIFAIMILITGMITFCYFSASLTNSMMRLNKMGADNDKQFWLLRRYLREHAVDKDLSLRVLRYLEFASSRKRDIVSEERIPILCLLSDQLKCELTYVVDYGGLLRHPLFKVAGSSSETIMTSLVEKVLTQKHLATNEVHFQVQDTATHMCMVISGELTYARDKTDIVELHTDDWACEQVLWLPWACRGSLLAALDSRIILVEYKEFCDVMQADKELWPMLTCYAEVFITWLNTMDQDELSDVFFGHTEHHMIEKFVEEARAIRKTHEEQAKNIEEHKDRARRDAVVIQ
jgi:hypothetical protein